MPDASVVEEQFVREIAKILTASTYQPYAVGNSERINQQFRLMRGWPVDQQLIKDLNASPTVTNITIFSNPGQRNTTRFLRQMMVQPVVVPDPTMFASISGNQITFEGSGSALELIGVSYGHAVGMAMRLTDVDTPGTVAAYFAAAITGSSASGPVLTLPTHQPVAVAIGTNVTSLREVHRQCGTWRVTIWAVNPQLRDQFASLIDPNLQGLDRFFFDDGSCSGPIIGAGFFINDVPEKQNLWKRDLLYETEYPTDTVSIDPTMVLGHGIVNSTYNFYTGVVDPNAVEGVGGVGGQGQTGL